MINVKEDLQEGVDIEIAKWQSQGINIRCERRDNRNGYKAGAMKEALTHSYVKQCDFVAVFDADFQPEPDYLTRAVPFLVHNPEVALVQARWTFGMFTIFALIYVMHIDNRFWDEIQEYVLLDENDQRFSCSERK